MDGSERFRAPTFHSLSVANRGNVHGRFVPESFRHWNVVGAARGGGEHAGLVHLERGLVGLDGDGHRALGDGGEQGLLVLLRHVGVAADLHDRGLALGAGAGGAGWRVLSLCEAA